MTFLLAEQGVLTPPLGDVLLFASTSAEHPGTYEFAAECTKRVEQEFSLPVFRHEFCAEEDATRGAYRRRRSYRLIKPVPAEEDPSWYLHLKGCTDEPDSRHINRQKKGR